MCNADPTLGQAVQALVGSAGAPASPGAPGTDLMRVPDTQPNIVVLDLMRVQFLLLIHVLHLEESGYVYDA